MNPKNIETKNPIKYKDIENLLNDTPEILSNLHPETNRGYLYSVFKMNCEDDVKNFMQKLDFYFNKREKHSEKFKKGEIDNPIFPLFD